MYECACKTIESLNVIKITFGQNQFITYYIMFNFRRTYFAHFQNISANSDPYKVKKQVEQKRSIPVVNGLIKIRKKPRVSSVIIV